MLKLLERSKPQFFPVHKWRSFNKEAQTQKTKQTKNTQHTHAEVVATYLHFSPSVVSEHVHQVAATKTQFYKISSCAFLGLTRKGEKNGTKSTTSKVEKGTDHYLSRGGGGGSSEDIICITINFTWSPMRLCNLMIPFHWQLVGTQFCLAPHPSLWSVGNQFPSFPHENHVITPKSSEPLPLERK